MPTLDLPIQTAPPSHSSPAQRIHLISDDLTGACDASAPFLPERSVRVWLGPTGDSAPEDVQAFNTDSRGLPPEAAAKAVSKCAHLCPPDALIFKKIDSAGRGPIAAELLAAHRALGTDIVLFTPSFPANGRIVSNGILHVYPASGLGTRLSLITLFSIKQRAQIAIVDKPSDLAVALASHKHIAICNAETDDELEVLVQFAATLNKRILYAGSAGLAHALAKSRRSHHQQPREQLPLAASPLLIVGTQHPVTLLQLAHLHQHQPDANLLTIRCDDTDADKIRTRFTDLNPDGLLLTGGDTALLTLRALGARSIELRGEIAPGIPWGIIDGGLADRRTLVTKSGGFGSATTLKEILTTLAGNA